MPQIIPLLTFTLVCTWYEESTSQCVCACVFKMWQYMRFLLMNVASSLGLFWTRYLYPLNSKFKKLLVGWIKVIFYKICHHWGKGMRNLLMSIEGCVITIASWIFLESLSSNPKLTSNARRFLTKNYVDFGNESRSVSYLQEIQSCLLRSREFLAKKSQP
jgi:hypothetical protein